MICPNCGASVRGGARQCPHCGKSLRYGGNTEFYQKVAVSKLGMKDVFSDVFKRHSKEDGERLFLAGTQQTTPREDEMLREWRKPWVFAWVGIIGIALTLALYVMSGQMRTSAGFMMLGSFVMPIATLLFYWEMNIPRNIPLYEILLMFLLGGVLSFFISVLFFQIIDTSYASFAAFCEEPGKLLALAFFLRKPEKKYALNGVLIGGAVGAGFAAIESAGYALGAFTGGGDAVSSVVVRGILAPGGHVVWAAIYGGALALVKGNEKLSWKHFQNVYFLKYFGIAIVLHFIWNSGLSICPLPFVGDFSYVILIIVAWIFLFMVLNKGIQQVLQISGGGLPARSPAAAIPAAGHAQLVGITGVYAGQTIALNQGQLVFGRDPAGCNLIFPANVAGISRKHCILQYGSHGAVLTDCHSSYGTFLDGGLRLDPDKPVQLQNGQRFYLGGKDVMFEVRL